MNHNPDWYNISLKVILKNQPGQVLILKNAEGTGEAGWHDIPGGRINVDEFTTPYEELIDREIKEEIGENVKYTISLDPVSFGRHWYDSERQKKLIKVFYIVFEGKYVSGDIVVSKEHLDFAWVNLEKLSLVKYFQKGMLEVMQRYLSLKNKERQR